MSVQSDYQATGVVKFHKYVDLQCFVHKISQKHHISHETWTDFGTMV